MTKTLVIEQHDYAPVEIAAESFHVGADEWDIRGNKADTSTLFVIQAGATVAVFRYWDRAYFKPESE